MKLFGKTTKKVKEKINPNADPANSSLANNKVKIKIYMNFGGETRDLRAEFFGIEDKDSYGVQIVKAENEKIDFYKKMEYVEEEVYTALNTTLGLAYLQKDEAIEKLSEKIAFHEKRIKALTKHVELNKYANIWDEKRMVRVLTIYKRYYEHRSPNGAYHKREYGLRVYEFVSKGGFLIPIWFGDDDLIDYPDNPSKQTISLQEDRVIEEYLNNKGEKRLVISTLSVVLVCIVVTFIALLIFGYKLLEKDQLIEDRSLASLEVSAMASAQCAQSTAEIHKMYNNLIQDAYIKDYLDRRNATSQVAGGGGNPILDNAIRVLS